MIDGKSVINKYEEICRRDYALDTSLYEKYHVKRGLRDKSGQGVVAGITNISKIVSYKEDAEGKHIPCDGELYYRGYSINDLVNGLIKDDRFGFEEIAYLLILGELPDKKQLEEFKTLLAEMRKLPRNFTKDVILKAPSKDMMMSLQRSVLTLASYDKKFDDIGVNNVIRQCLWLVSVFPMLAVYGYHAYNHFINDDSLYIHHPDPDLSTAENFLRMLRPDKSFTPLEASVLDLALILHMEHGGGNNSTFTTRVVTSSGTDTYSAISAALASLKGPKHGGANIKVVQMMRNIRENVHDLKDEDEIYAYLSAQNFAQGDVRPQGVDLRHGARGLFAVRPARAGVQGVHQEAVSIEGQVKALRLLRARRAACDQGNRVREGDLQGRQRKRRLLQRICLQHAGHSDGALHPDVRDGAHSRLVGAPSRRADQRGQDHPPRLSRHCRDTQI